MGPITDALGALSASIMSVNHTDNKLVSDDNLSITDELYAALQVGSYRLLFSSRDNVSSASLE